jgi:hypothetical protein
MIIITCWIASLLIAAFWLQAGQKKFYETKNKKENQLLDAVALEGKHRISYFDEDGNPIRRVRSS